MTNEYPILFSDPMVQAIMSGTKTQTRRIVKPQPTTENGCPGWGTYDGPRQYMVPRRARGGSAVTMTDLIAEYCPHGTPGDLLWVRETWAVRKLQAGYWAEYRADGSNARIPNECHEFATRKATVGTWQPSIFMPRWMSRLTLRITSVRVERVQDISEADARAEGWHMRREVSSDPAVHADAARDWFADLWDGLNAKRGYGWASNPWVWAIGFEVVR